MTYEYYKGYRITMERVETGWRALIRPPNTVFEIPGPIDASPTSYKTVLMETKNMIDRKAV